MNRLFDLLKANKVILTNAGSLIGTWGVTSGLGFVYWWLAARAFVPQEVGIGSASVSIMTLLGTICIMGLGTLLITELPRHPDQAGPLISTSLIVVGAIGGSIGVLFALVAPDFSASFSPLRTSMSTVVVFGLGVSLTSITLVLDQALIGLLLGGIQLWRNGLFALGKLVVLFSISLWFSQAGGMGVYAAWAAGNLISLVPLAFLVMRKKGARNRSFLLQWSLLRKLGGSALQHHLLNLVVSAPALMLPVMVTVLLSVQANAWFYVAWMVANIVFIVPGALTTVLHAVNSAQQAGLRQRARITLSLAFGVSAAAIGMILLGAHELLSIFGHTYADQASWTLRILALGALPNIVKNHYVSICRIYDRILQALSIMAVSFLLELGGAALGAHMAGLVGLALGWVGALVIESTYMSPTIYRAVFAKQPAAPQEVDAGAFWIMDTALLPAMGGGYAGTEPVWLMNTALQAAIRRPSTEVKPVWLVETTRLPAITTGAPIQYTTSRIMRKNRLERLRSTSVHPRVEYTLTTDPALEREPAHNHSPVLEKEML
jgi:O-antigen/teichoic acid export membrane protein